MTKLSKHTQRENTLRSRILGSTSTAGVAVAMMLGSAVVAEAQETVSTTTVEEDATVDEKREDVIVVTGIRSSLERAIEVKRNADNIVDGISAESIGRFPDLNLAESLQRISGVQIVRDDFRNGQVAIRGITGFSKTQVNGQDLASPNFGGAFVYGIFESAVLSGVDVMKTPLVSMDEGGIAGVINLKTRGALDFEEDRHFFVSAKGQYEGLNEAFMPDLGMSAGFKNAAGNMGAYISVGYQEKDFRSDSAKITEYAAYDSTYVPDAFGSNPGRSLSSGQLDALDGDLSGILFVPKRARYTSRGTTGDRISIAGGAEWRVSDELNLKLSSIFAESNSQQPLNTISLMTFGTRGFLFDVLDTQDEGQLGTTATRIRVHSPQMQVQERIRDQDFQTWATTLDADWEKGPWSVHGALHYTAAETRQSQHQIVSRIENRSSASGNTFLDNGLVAELTTGAGDPYGFGFTLNRPFSDIGTFGWSTTNTPDPSDHLFAGIFTGGTNNYDRSEEQIAVQIDVSRDLDIAQLSFIDSVDFGVKFKSVDQENQSKSFRSIFNNSGANLYDISAWDDSFFRDSFLDDGSGFFGGDVAFPGLLVPDSRRALDALVVNPAELRDDGIRLDLIDPETGLVFDSLGTGVHDNTQDITAIYASANFDETIPGIGIGLRGNIGVRYVKTERSNFNSAVETVQNFPGIPDSNTRVDVEGNFDFENVLPQVNLIFDVTDDLTFRASYSETMNRLNPDSIRAGSNFSARPNNNGELRVTRASDRSRLLPNTAKSFDVAAEWYNRAGSTVHGAVFTKNIENSVVIQGICEEAATVPGIAPFVSGTPAYDGASTANGGLGDCRDAAGTIFSLSRRFNTGDTFRVSGAEFGFTQNLDFLDGWMSNLGVTANYTYLYKHTPNPDDSVSGSRFDTGGSFVGSSILDQLSLSPHSFNLIGYYETDKIGLRFAGNFRSNFVDGRSLGGFLGADRIVDDRVQWDFSGSYNVTDQFTLGAEMINIFDEDRYEYQGTERRHRNLFSEGRTMTISASYNF